MKKFIIVSICSAVIACLVLSFSLYFLFRVQIAEADSINFLENSPEGMVNLVTVLDDRVQIRVKLQNMKNYYPVRQFYNYKCRIDEDSLIFNVYYRNMYPIYTKSEQYTGRISEAIIEIMCDTQDLQKVIFEGKNEVNQEIIWIR